VVDYIFLSTPESYILGAGLLNDNLLLFTSKDNLVQIIPKESIWSVKSHYSITNLFTHEITYLPSTLMGTQNLSLRNTEISVACDGTIETLKNAFRLYRRGEKVSWLNLGLLLRGSLK